MPPPIRNARPRQDVGPFSESDNKRKTSHVSRACNTCRRKKSKCNGVRPVCKTCQDSGHECTWTSEEDSRRPATKQYVESLKHTNTLLRDRVTALEGLLQQSGIQYEQFSAPVSVNAPTSSPYISVPSGPYGTNSGGPSPTGSSTDLPSDSSILLAPDENSDVESVADSLSNAAARIVLDETGQINVVGPSSTIFHGFVSKSPITRTVPLPDAPRHQLQIEGGSQQPESIPHHQRNPSNTSQSGSKRHSRSPSFTGGRVSPPAFGLSPGGHASPGIFCPPSPGLEAHSPASDYSGTVNQDVDVSSYDALMGGGAATSPRTVQGAKPEADSEEEYDWAQFLPRGMPLTREEHDTLLDAFFKFFSSWCFRTEPEEFLIDMRKYLTVTYSGSRLGDANDSSQDALTSPSVDHHDAQSDVPIKAPKVAHYTPMLHNSILALALAYSDNPYLSRIKTRALFVDQAKRYLEAECARPSLACVHALAYLASYYSGQGEQNLGFLFFGMSVRMSQALGLGLDCSNWVRSGHISTLDEQDRVATFWTTYCLDKCWAFYVARDLGVPNPLYTSSTSRPLLLKRESEASVESSSSSGSSKPPGMSIRLPEVEQMVDEQIWEWRAPVSGRMGNLASKSSQAMPCHFTSVFQQTCKLMLLATKIMNVTWNLPRGAGDEVISSLAVEVDGWLEELPDPMRITRPKTCTSLPHVLMINMAHQWLQILLHRPFYRRLPATHPSVKRCDAGAEKILAYLTAWRRLYNLRFVPITAVQIAFVAGTTCLLKAVQSIGAPETRKKALDGVRECVRALNEMGRTWSSAEQSARTLKRLLKEQLTAQEFSPMPSRNPTLEVQPPSAIGSRQPSMDVFMLSHEGGSNRAMFGESIWAAEPAEISLMDTPFGGSGVRSESPSSQHGSDHGQTFFGPNLGYSGMNDVNNNFQSGAQLNPLPSLQPLQFSAQSGLHQQVLQQQHQHAHGVFVPAGAFPEFESFIAPSTGRLRGGEGLQAYPAPGPFNPYGDASGMGALGVASNPGRVSPTTGGLDWQVYGTFGQQQSQQQPGYWGS